MPFGRAAQILVEGSDKRACKAALKHFEYIRDCLRRNRAAQDTKSGPLLDMVETELKQQGARPEPPPKRPISVEIKKSKDGQTTVDTFNFPMGDTT